MAKREKTSLSLDPDLMIAVGHRCLDLRIDKSDAVEIALRQWLEAASPKVEGEFLKCPRHLIPVIQGIINDLSDPAQYDAILQEGVRAKMKHDSHGIKKVK